MRASLGPLALVGSCVLALWLAPASRAHDAISASQASTYHVLFTSARDGDEDIYTVDMRSRPAALTRNNADDFWAVVAPSGHFSVDRPGTGGFLVSPDGRRERPLGHVSFGGDATFSPDGRQLAIAQTDAFDNDRMMLVPVRGGPARPLGRGQPHVFSRDGRFLAFHIGGELPGLTDLRTGQRRVFATPPGCCDYGAGWVWSPKLTRFAYLRDDPSNFRARELVVVGARPPTPATVVVRGDFDEGSIGKWVWLDERLIAVQRGQELVVIDVARNTERVIASVVLDWAASPRGDALAYSAGDGLLVVSALDGSQRRSQPVPHPFRDLTWSTGGDRLAAVGSAGNACCSGRRPLYVLELKPRWRLRRVTWKLRGDVSSIVWSPDGRMLALDNGGVTLLTVPGGHVRRTGLRPKLDSLAWARGPVPVTARPLIPVPPPETGGAVFRSRGPVLEISSSGSWVAAIVGTARAACTHVVAWRAGGSLTRVRQDFDCEYDYLVALKLNGTHLSWSRWTEPPCGISGCELAPFCADLRQPGRGCRAGDELKANDPPPRPRPPREVHRGLSMTLRRGVLLVRRPRDGRQTTVRVPTRIVDAELENAGLFYAWNDARGSGKVAFISFGELVDRLT